MSDPKIGGPVQSTDRELWREREDDYYADSIHVTKDGGIGINCGGYVIVKSLRGWHQLAKVEFAAPSPERRDTETPAKFPRTGWTLDDGRRLSLITIAELRTLPQGAVLTCIDGKRVTVGGDKPIDEDTRRGFLAFGFEESHFSASAEGETAQTPKE